MKFTKLTKKLLLSALSLGLAVVTLTTTTFAWYTSSTDASVSEGQGTSSSKTSDNTLLISTDYNPELGTDNGNWGNTATLPTLDEIVPLEWKDGKFSNLANDTAVTEGYYEFTVYFKTTKTEGTSTSKIPVYLTSLSIANSLDEDSESLREETNILGAGSTEEGCPNEAVYSVDIVRALAIVVNNSGSAYNLDGITTVNTEAEKGFTSIDDADAVKYYNKVMAPTTVTRTESLTTFNGVNQVAVEITHDGSAYEIVSVTYAIYLNGWDQYCFDACRGQSFTVSAEFSTVNPN